MVFLFHIDRPDVVVGTVQVFDGQHRCVHRVVLVVVLVHAVAANEMDVGSFGIDPRTDRGHVVLVFEVVVRIRLRDTHHVAHFDILGSDESECLKLFRPEGNQILVRHRPDVIVLKDEVLETQARAAVLDHKGRPGSEVLDSADLDLGGVDVDPVVRKALVFRDDQGNGQKIAVMQIIPGCEHRRRRSRCEGTNKVIHGHRRDHMGHLMVNLLAVRPDHRHRGRHPLGHVDGDHARPHGDGSSGGLHQLLTALPHHPRPVLWVLELLNEAGDVRLLPLGCQGVDDGIAQR